jgi:hypothetical protein
VLRGRALGGGCRAPPSAAHTGRDVKRIVRAAAKAFKEVKRKNQAEKT